MGWGIKSKFKRGVSKMTSLLTEGLMDAINSNTESEAERLARIKSEEYEEEQRTLTRQQQARVEKERKQQQAITAERKQRMRGYSLLSGSETGTSGTSARSLDLLS